MFDSLDPKSMAGIAELMVSEIARESQDNGVKLTVGDGVYEKLAKEGFDEKYGARPMRRYIQRHIEDELAEMYLRGDVNSGDTVKIFLDNGEIRLQKAED